MTGPPGDSPALGARTSSVAGSGSPKSSERPVRIALWGPTAAGKTVLIAQLFIHHSQSRNGTDWEIYPDEASLDFIKRMRERIYRDNRFPKATVVGAAEDIVYNFKNKKTGSRASMVVEDRAGVDFEKLHAEAQQRLRTAGGLILLFDATRTQGQLQIEIAQTLDEVNVSLGERDKDPRPIAVCLSKADVLIRSLADYDQALDDGTRFVSEKVHGSLIRTVENRCSHYRLFPMSSAGLVVRHGFIKPNVFYDEDLNPRIGGGGRPLNLLEPFAWVLDEVMS